MKRASRAAQEALVRLKSGGGAGRNFTRENAYIRISARNGQQGTKIQEHRHDRREKMTIRNQAIYLEASAILFQTYGAGVSFRDGQYEAIEATMTGRRTLIVQKTGWGKSLVYFISTKMNRNHGHGMTMVISPLLVLMDNQMDFARRMGIRCAALNSRIKKNSEERSDIIRQLKNDQIDMLFITPETLMSDEIQRMLPDIRIGLFVVDEVHCISDWGHDFRLEYGRLGRIIRGVFSNVPVLATTATANDRVIQDLKAQLGDDVYISRGSLTRPSLHIQVLRLEGKTDRYAWLLENLPKLPGTGIVYCITKRDCEHLATFLNQNRISACSYTAGETDESNDKAISAFYENRIKVIVATTKLGMGYDKGDISFVIHYQSPPNIVAWYQQIGRAGRDLKDAYIFLMHGKEDDDINNYFIETAFPSRKESSEVMEAIANANGLTQAAVESQVNFRRSRIDNALKFLENEGFIRKEHDGRRYRYYSTPRRFEYNEKHYQEIMSIRRHEMEQMHQLIHTTECLSRFAVNALDDHTAGNCGKCFNCTGRDIFPNLTVSIASKDIASAFINASLLTIDPRKKWPDGKFIKPPLMTGICLSKYGDSGYGEMVKNGKYPPSGYPKRFNDQLVKKSASVLDPLIKEKGITHITFVPSLRSNLVKDFTSRLADKVHLQYVELLEKSDAPQQKEMENSTFQCNNAMNSFRVRNTQMPERVILVDDVVDSKWTLTVCGNKLLESGCQEVYPFALADSSHEEN